MHYWSNNCSNAFQVMALRLILMIEAHRLHPYQRKDDISMHVTPPNLGKIDHLNVDILPEVALEYLKASDLEVEVLPESMTDNMQQ